MHLSTVYVIYYSSLNESQADKIHETAIKYEIRQDQSMPLELLIEWNAFDDELLADFKKCCDDNNITTDKVSLVYDW